MGAGARAVKGDDVLELANQSRLRLGVDTSLERCDLVKVRDHLLGVPAKKKGRR